MTNSPVVKICAKKDITDITVSKGMLFFVTDDRFLYKYENGKMSSQEIKLDLKETDDAGGQLTPFLTANEESLIVYDDSNKVMVFDFNLNFLRYLPIEEAYGFKYLVKNRLFYSQFSEKSYTSVLSVYDIKLGKTVFAKQFSSKFYLIEFLFFAGIYYLKLRDLGTVHTKLVVMNSEFREIAGDRNIVRLFNTEKVESLFVYRGEVYYVKKQLDKDRNEEFLLYQLHLQGTQDRLIKKIGQNMPYLFTVVENKLYFYEYGVGLYYTTLN